MPSSVTRRLFLAAAGAAAGAVGARSFPAAAGPTLKLVHDPYPPYVDDSLPRGGLATDIATTVLERAGFAAEVALVPWARALQGAGDGVYDAMLSAWYTPERDRLLAFSESYAVNRVRFVAARGREPKNAGPEHLAGLRIGVVRGYAYEPAFMARTDLVREEVRDLVHALQMVAAGRLDLALEEERVARHTIAVRAPELTEKLVFLDPPLSENGMRLAVSRRRPDHAEIVSRFNGTLVLAQADGTLAEIYRRHGFQAEA